MQLHHTVIIHIDIAVKTRTVSCTLHHHRSNVMAGFLAPRLDNEVERWMDSHPAVGHRMVHWASLSSKQLWVWWVGMKVFEDLKNRCDFVSVKCSLPLQCKWVGAFLAANNTVIIMQETVQLFNYMECLKCKFSGLITLCLIQ